MYKKATRIFFFLLLCFFFLGPVFVFVSKTPMDNILIRGGLERFFIASLILIPIAASASVHKFATKFLFSKYIYIVYLLFILVPIALLFLNFSKVNQKRNYLYEEFGELMFAQLPPNSLLITFGDKGGMISRYMQVALNKRTDVLAVNFNFIPDKWYKENLQQRFPSFPYPYDKFQPFKLSAREAVDIICKEVVPNQPTFIENKTDFFNPIANNNCSYHMQGPVVRLDSPQNRLTKEALIAEYQRFWQPLEQKFPQRVHDYKTRTLLDSYAQAETFLGALLGLFGENDTTLKAYIGASKISQDNGSAPLLAAQIYRDQKNFDEAQLWYEKAIKADPWLSTPYKDLGLLYLNEKNDKKKTLYYFKKYLKLAPNEEERREIENLIRQIEQEL